MPREHRPQRQSLCSLGIRSFRSSGAPVTRSTKVGKEKTAFARCGRVHARQKRGQVGLSIFQLLATNILTQCRESKETAHTCGNLYALQLAACQLPSAGSPSAHRRGLSLGISSGPCWPSHHKTQSSGNKLWHHHAACCTAGLFWTIQAVWWQHATSCETS